MPRMKQGDNTKRDNAKLIIAYNIRKKRDAVFQTGAQAAAEANVKHSQWSNWETGSRKPSEKNLERVAKILRCTVDDLKREPENWASEKIAYFAKRKKSLLPAPTNPEDEADADLPPLVAAGRINKGITDYLQIISLLAQVQEKYNQGGIDAQTFTSKMQSIKDFVHYEYRHVLPDSKA